LLCSARGYLGPEADDHCLCPVVIPCRPPEGRCFEFRISGGAMKTAEDILKTKSAPLKITIAPDQTIAQAVDKMNRARVGAILVEEAPDRIIGIWTERDLLKSLTTPGFDPHKGLIADYMQTKLFNANHDTPLIELEEMFLGLFIRHIVILKEGRFVGLLSIGDVLRASLLEKDHMLKKLNKIASWQYYENWGWDREKSKKK
jgi:CBS domain-containing protein